MIRCASSCRWGLTVGPTMPVPPQRPLPAELVFPFDAYQRVEAAYGRLLDELARLIAAHDRALERCLAPDGGGFAGPRARRWSGEVADQLRIARLRRRGLLDDLELLRARIAQAEQEADHRRRLRQHWFAEVDRYGRERDRYLAQNPHVEVWGSLPTREEVVARAVR